MFTIISYSIHVYHDFSIKLDVMTDLLSEVYMVSWMRICPYLMGTLTSIYLHKNGGRFEVSQVKALHFLMRSFIVTSE